jgi:long-chain acyl-CoA synthetase
VRNPAPWPYVDEHRADVSCWVFDVDGCLVDSLTGTSLRPGTRELLIHLRNQQHTVIWWSAGGKDYGRGRATQLDVHDLVDGFYGKEHRDHQGRYQTDHFLDPGREAVFIDDRPEDMPVGAMVISVAPYIVHNPHDRGLRRAAEWAGLPVAGSESDRA